MMEEGVESDGLRASVIFANYFAEISRRWKSQDKKSVLKKAFGEPAILTDL